MSLFATAAIECKLEKLSDISLLELTETVRHIATGVDVQPYSYKTPNTFLRPECKTCDAKMPILDKQ